MWAAPAVLTALIGLPLKNSLAFLSPAIINHRIVVPRSSPCHVRRPSSWVLSASYADEAVDNLTDDESIRVAYDKWRAKYNKGDSNPTRFDNFKKNYVTLMRANTAALRKANELGMKLPSLMSLNEHADCSVDEFKAKRSGHSPPPSSSESKGTQEPAAEAVRQDNSGYPMESSNGYPAQESNVFQTYESPRSAEEVSDDGNPAPDRVRRAYIDWCKEYGKTVEEERYEVFRSHFLAIEKHCLETGKEMKLNAWADFTPGEYVRAQGVASGSSTSKRGNKLSDPDFLRSRTKDESASTSSSSGGALESLYSSIPTESVGTQSEANVQEDTVEPPSLDPLYNVVAEEPPEPSASSSDISDSVNWESKGYDFASYAESLSKSSHSNEDTSQRSYLDAMAMQKTPTSSTTPQETPFTRDLDKQAQSWNSFNQVDSGEKDEESPSYVAAADESEAQVMAPPDQTPAPKVEENDSEEGIDVYLKRKEDAKIAVQEALERRKQLAERRVALEKEAAEAERRRSEAEKTVKAANANVQNWDSLKTLFNVGASDTRRESPAELGKSMANFGLEKIDSESTSRTPSFSFGDWFGNKKQEEKPIEPDMEAAKPAKNSDSIFDFFGSIDRKPPKALDKSPPKALAKTVPKALDKTPPKTLEKTPPEQFERAKPANDWWKSIVFDFFGAQDDDDDDDIKRVPGRGTVRIADQGYPKKSPFDLFIPDSASLWRKSEPGRATIRIEKDPKPSIFSFFANKGPQSPLFPFLETKNPSKKNEKEGKVDKSNSIFSFLGLDKGSFFFGNTPNDSVPTMSPAEKKKREAAIAERRKTQEVKVGKINQARERALQEQQLKKQSNPTIAIGRGTYSISKSTIEDATPSLSMWTQNENGSITGFISNAKNYKDGTKITTSPAPMGAKPGAVVKTYTGSTYRLGLNIDQPTGGPASFLPWSAENQVKDDVPVLTSWSQNPEDDTLCGCVKNSKDFLDGSMITTSPVRKGVKKGDVVRTRGGSLYRLE